MTDESRSIELEVEVDGTPEEVWQAIATGPGISSWYVPHVVEERDGGEATASFGPGMDITGRVVTWDPPNRIVFDGGEDGGSGLAFEWTVETRDGGACVVRLVNSGFGTGGPWDDHYDAMTAGWAMFLRNLQLHLTHFRGQAARPILPLANWSGPPTAAWKQLRTELGLSETLQPGDRISLGNGADIPDLDAEVVAVGPTRVALLIDKPAPGTGFIAAEGQGTAETAEVSVWCYLYGDEWEGLADDHDRRWRAWLSARAVPAEADEIEGP